MKLKLVMVAVVILSFVLLGSSHALYASETSHATVIFQFGNGENVEYTVSFSGTQISALNATISACENLSLYLNYTVGAYGAFVQQIGWEKNDFSAGIYWHLMVWKNGSARWSLSDKGASSLYLSNGEVISWIYTADDSSWQPLEAPHAGPGYFDSWASPRGNFNNTAVSNGNITGKDIMWRFNGSSSWGFSSTPVVADGAIYIADSYALYAINMAGSELWNNSLGAAGYWGLSSPVVFDNYVIIYSTNHTIRAFYRNNGTLAWETTINGNVTASPAIGYYNHAAVLFYATFAQNQPGSLYAIYAENGTIIWNRALFGSNYFGAPAIMDNSVVVSVAGIENTSYSWNPPYGLQCIAFNGTYLWNYSSSESVRSPAVVSNGRIYFVSAGTTGALVALNMNGTLAWKLNIGGATAAPAVHGKMIYVGNNSGYIIAVQDNGSFGSVVWSEKLNGAVKAGIIYASGKVAVATDTSNSEIYCFYDNGTLAWNVSLGANSYVLSSPVVVGSYLLVATNSGTLYTFADNTSIPAMGEVATSSAIVGQPIMITVNTQSTYTAVLYYRNVTGDQWHAVWMYYSAGKYVAFIPAQSSTGSVEYYVVLTDTSGSSSTSAVSQTAVTNTVPEFPSAILLIFLIFGIVIIRRNR